MPPTRRAERDRGRRRSDVLSRVLVAVPAAVVAVVFVDLGGLAWTAFMILMGILCTTELYSGLERWRPIASVGWIGVVALCLTANWAGTQDVLGVAILALPVVFVGVLIRGRTSGATVTIAGTLLGVWWIGLAFAHAVLLRRLDHGSGILIDVMVGTFLGDTGAYFAGRLFGRRPLAPEISPKKTVEGLVGGMILTILAVFFAGLYQPWLGQEHAFVLGLSIAVLGPMGDLFASLIKRDAGLKDFGTLFGAHGGALDRLDAVIFTIVAAYYIWSAALGHG